MEDFTSFRKFITPSIITIIFWIGVVASVISGLVMFVGAFGRYGGGAAAALMGLLTIVIGPLVARIYCELIILGFKIYDTLIEIRDAQTGSAGNSAPQPPPPTF